MLPHGLWRPVTLFPRQGASCQLCSRHTRFSGASAWHLPKACTHFGQHFCLPAAKGLWKGQFLGACRASFYTWHSPHAVPHMKGHAALLRPGKGNVCKEGLYEVSILSIESAALSLLTTWHIFCTVLPLSGDRREGGSL